MSFLTGLSLTAILAAVAAFFSQARQFFRHLSGLILLQKTITGGLVVPVGVYIRAHYRKMPSGLSTYTGILGVLGDSSRNSYIPYEIPNANSIWRGPHGTFLVHASSTMTLISLRGLSDPKELIREALRFWEKLSSQAEDGMGNFYVRQIMGSAGDLSGGDFASRHKRLASESIAENDSPAPSGGVNSSSDGVGWGGIDNRIDESFMYRREEYIRNKQGKDPLRGLFFDEPVHRMIADCQRWFKQRSWYEERGIPWRMGVMLHGPGGTGKSSLAKAVAQKLGVTLNQFYLNTMTDREFLSEWDNMTTPCVVAFEDFDTVFNGREPVTVHKSLSFECVLNKISGISSRNGILLFVNTNHLENVDPALGQIDENGRPTRPGRIDRILELKYTSAKVQSEIAEYILGGWADDLKAEAVNQGGEALTAAQFQSMCVQLAIERASINQL